MELLGPCLFFYLLAILLSLSISSTTNSDPTKAETLQLKGGEGVKRSRVRRQNLNLQHALRLPEKAYAFYMLWRLLNEINDTNTKPLTVRPDKLEFTTSEGPKNMESEVKTSSAPIQDQSTHSIGMTGTNDSTVIASFSTEPSSLDSQKTTQLEDLHLGEQSTRRLQTTIEKITEPNTAIEQHIPDSTTSKIPSTAAEEPSTIAIHEQIDHFTGNNDTNNFTTMASFPTHSSSPNSQETTPSGDSQLNEKSTQRVQTTKQKITEASEVTEQHILDSTIFSTKISSKAAAEPSIALHEQINHVTGINGTNNSTTMASFHIDSLPDSQETTPSGDSRLAEKSTQRVQTTKQKIIEASEVTEQHILDSTTFTNKVSSKAAEEPSSTTIYEQINHFTGINGTNIFTAMVSLPTQSSLPDSQETTQSGDSQIAEQSDQHFQTTKQNITEASEVTEQHILDSTIFSTKISSKAAEEPSITLHEQINHVTGINGTNKSTTMASFHIDSLPDSQETTPSGDSRLAEKSTQRVQTTKQKIIEASEVTEQHILDSTTFANKVSSKAAEEPSSTTIQEQINHFTGINGTNISTAMVSLPTQSSLPDSQETTPSGDSQLFEPSVQRVQTTKQKMTEPSEVTEKHILDSTIFSTKISSKAAEPSIALHEQINHVTGINGTNNSTTMASFHIDSLPDSQETTPSGDSRLAEKSTQRVQTTKQKIIEASEVTEQHILDSTTFTNKVSSKAAEEPSSTTIYEQINHFTGINGTNISTAMVSLPTQSSLPDSQETTQSGDSQIAEQSDQHFQTTKQNITEASEVTEQHILDSTIFSTKISSKAAEEPSITLHEQINHVTGINGTNKSTTMASFHIDSLPDSQETTPSGDSRLAEKSTQRVQTTKQKIIEASEVTEQHILDSTTFTNKVSSKAAEEPSSTTIYEQINHFTGINGTNISTAMVSLPTQSSLPDSQETTQSGDSQIAEQSDQHFQTTKQNITEASEVTEQHILDSTIFSTKISSKAAEEPSITLHEQINHVTGINGTNKSTTMASFHIDSLPDSQETTPSGDSRLAEKSTQRVQTTKQKIIEASEVTEQHILDSTTFTNKVSSKAAEEPSSTTIYEQINHFTGINGTNISTAMVSLPTQSSLPDSQETTQSGDSQLFEPSVQRVQTTKQKMTEPSEVTEKHILDSTIFSTKISSKAAEPSIALHEQINHVTGINGTNKSTTMASFHIDSLPDSQETTPSGDSQIAEQSTQRVQTTKQKIIEASEVTEQHILDSTTFTNKVSSKAAEEPSSTTIYEQINHFTGIKGTNISTAMVSLPTQSSLPDSQETTQSGDSQIAEQSDQHFQTTKQNITEASEVTEQHILDSTIFSTKISSKAAEEPSITLHEQINHVTGINGTNKSTTMASFHIDSLPDSQETTPSGDSQIAEQSDQRVQTTKHKIIEPSEVTEQHILDSTTLTNKISSKAAEEPSSTTIHEQINHFTGINGTHNSTAVAPFPIQSSLPDSQKTTQTGDSEIVEESPQQENPEAIIRSTGTNGTNDSTPIMSFPTDLPPQESQKNTQSGAPQLLKHSTQHLQILKQKVTAPSQKIVQPTALMSTPDQATTYRIQQTTPLQYAIDPHIPNNDILASTMENENLKPTSLSQMTKNEQPKMTPVINGMVQSISKPTPPARTKQTTLSTVKPEIKKNSPHTLSVTWQSGKPNWLVTSTDWRVSKPMPPTFTLKQQIQDSTSLLLTEDSPNSDLSESTSDPEHHKPKPTEEPINQHTEKNTTNTAKSSRDSLMQPFMTTNTHRLTNDPLVSSKKASTSPLPILTENHLVDSKGPEDTSVLTGISLQDTTSFRTYRSDAKTQSQRTTNKYTILGKMTSHTSFPLVKDTSTQAPTDGVRSSQTIPVSTEKLITMFTPNPKPSEKRIHTTSVVRHGFLTSRTQENPSWISKKRSNIQPTETEESQSDSINQEPTADSMPKENDTNNDLLTKTDKPTQSMSGRKPSTTTRITTTRPVSRKPKTFILPKHKSANTAIEDGTKTRRDIFGLLFTFGCLMLLITVIMLRVIWRKWQTRRCGSNMWVAGPPLLWGTYHSVLQNSSSHTAIQMRKENSKKTKQENSDVFETIALKQQHRDLV